MQMSKTNIGELARQLADKNVLGQMDAEVFIRKMFDLVDEGLKTDKLVKIKWFGTFKVQAVKDRESVDVNTGERIVIEGRDKISFTPDSILKEIINKPFAQFDTVVVNDGVDFGDIDQKFEETEVENADEALADSQVIVAEPRKAIAPHDVSESKEPKQLLEEDLSETSTVKCVESDKSPNVASSRISAVLEGASALINKEHEDTNENPQPKTVEAEAQSVVKHHLMIPRYAVVLVILIVGILVVGIGYLAFNYGKMQVQRDELALLLKQQHRHESQKRIVKKSAASQPEKILRKKSIEDSLRMVKEAEAVAAAEAAKGLESSKKLEMQPVEKKTTEIVEKDKATQDKIHDVKYDDDPRVRTGAYRIVGVQQVVIAKGGQTLSAISSHYLGPGMVCYLEALNGSEPLKEGQKVKIPKLILKKK